MQALPQQQQQQKNPFQGYSQQLDGLQKFLGDTPKPALLFAALASVAASGYLGNLLGSQAPGDCSYCTQFTQDRFFSNGRF